VGTEIPVGDPLTPGGGPGRAELRLEEEEVKEESKEVEVTEEAKRTRTEEAFETPSPQQGWELFGHLLIEDLQVRGRISVMRCVRCGASAPLTDLKVLKETPCITEKAGNTEKREAMVSLPRKCENCGRESAASLCDSCADTFERYALTARPAPLRGRGGIKPPNVPGVDGWGWVSSLTTFFPYKQGEGGREWWCPVPGCKKTARKLIEIVDHFRGAHPFEASRGWYEEYDARSRQVRIRAWQGWVNEDTMELVMEEVEK
jgi:hypothetical protein